MLAKSAENAPGDQIINRLSKPPNHFVLANICRRLNSCLATVGIIAFLDADSVPAADWLASLLAPLADPDVGAATGIRWFVPPPPQLAASSLEPPATLRQFAGYRRHSRGWSFRKRQDPLLARRMTGLFRATGGAVPAHATGPPPGKGSS
jgi:hypothetical protein